MLKKLLEASEFGNMELFKEMKKIRGSKKNRSELPEIVEDVSGEHHIVEKFREVYEQLYNSWDTSSYILGWIMSKRK